MKDIYEHLHSYNYGDCILSFDGVTLVGVSHEPSDGCYEDVEFDDDSFSFEGENRHVTTDTSGSKEEGYYQVDLFVGNILIKTMMVQTTPNGNIYSDK